ncbi:rhomboid family protein [Albidovulum inexpectatum]|uniref:Rhomboid family protein n=1 Tax=Albidovulum inexpectatum TaxID=196587 RepID=A0A2S5JDX7_9RHOB|nr:rhomboid family intramembrane serine protease [Albidovulum inexpectatum]PPB79653.1 rhomboid family protein [Albidovulum inexpectatum]
MRRDSPLAPVTWAILILCTLPELILTGADLGLWGSRDWRGTALALGAFWKGLGPGQALYPGQPVAQYVTYGFLHGGMLHLVMNMTVMVSLARALVPVLGQARFAMLYLASLVAGAAAFGALGTVGAPMVGASGAVFGLLGAWLRIDWMRRRRLGASTIPVVQSLVGLAVLNTVLWWAMGGLLAWETHLGGFVAGWALLPILLRR